MELKEAIERVEHFIEFCKLREKTHYDFLFSLKEKDIPIEAIDTVLEELNNRIPKKDIQEILDYQYDLWNTPNKQKEFNLELVETLENLLDKE